MTNMERKDRYTKTLTLGLVLLVASVSAHVLSGTTNSQETIVKYSYEIGPTPTFSPTPLPSVAFSQTAFFEAESLPAMVSVMRIQGQYTGPLNFRISTIDGTATGGAACGPGIDFVQLDNVPVMLNAGDGGKSIEVRLCADDVSEAPETVNLAISGNVSLPTTATLTISDEPLQFTISGRVLTADGRGIRNAEVVMLSPVGPHRIVRTSSFGWYSFDGLSPGRGYTMNVSSRRFEFQTFQLHVPLLISDVTNVNFVAEPLP